MTSITHLAEADRGADSTSRARAGRHPRRSRLVLLAFAAATLAGGIASSPAPASAAQYSTPVIECNLTTVEVDPAIAAGTGWGPTSGYYQIWLYASDGRSTRYTQQWSQGTVRGPDLGFSYEVARPVTFNVQPGLHYTALVKRWDSGGGVWRPVDQTWTLTRNWAGYVTGDHWCKASL